MSPTYFVFTVAAVKSRPMRSAAFAAAGSATVVRCFLRSRSPPGPTWRMMPAILLWLTGLPIALSSAVIRGTP